MDPLLDMVHSLLCEDADEAVDEAEGADQALGTAAAAYAFAVRHAAFTVVCSLVTLFPERLSATILAPLRIPLPPVLRKALIDHVEQESAARVPQLLREGVAGGDGTQPDGDDDAGSGEEGAAAVGTLMRPSRDLATAVGPAGLAPGFDDAYDMRTPSRVLLLPLATAAAANPADHELVSAVAAFRVKCGKFYESIATSALKQVRAAAPKEHAAAVLLAMQREYERLRLLREDPDNQDARQVLGVEDYPEEGEGDAEASDDGDRAAARALRAQRLTGRLAAKLASSFGVARLGGDRHDAVFLLLVNGMRYALGEPPSRLPFLDLLHPFLKLLSPKGKRVLLSTTKGEVQQMGEGPVQRRLVRWLEGAAAGGADEDEELEDDQQHQMLAFPAFVAALDPTNKAATAARPATSGAASKRRERPAASKRRRASGKSGAKAASPATAKRRRSAQAASVARSQSTAAKSNAASSMARQGGARASLDLDNLSGSSDSEGGDGGGSDHDSVGASQQSAALAVSQRRRAARKARASVGTQPAEPESRKRAELQAEGGDHSDSEVSAGVCPSDAAIMRSRAPSFQDSLEAVEKSRSKRGRRRS